MSNLINIPIELTDVGYQKTLKTNGVAITIKELALGSASSNAGYSVGFRDSRTELVNEVVRKQIDASKRDEEQGKIDFAVLFDGDEEFDVWELGFFDEDGDLVYIWSHETEKFAPKSKFLQLAISLSLWVRHINISQVTVQDAGQPWELFLSGIYAVINRLTNSSSMKYWKSGLDDTFVLGSDNLYYVAVSGSDYKTNDPVGDDGANWRGGFTLEEIIGQLLAGNNQVVDVPLASSTQDGLMSKTDKSKLDNLVGRLELSVIQNAIGTLSQATIKNKMESISQ